jgi:SAM-dependent methyltransferase
VTAAERGWEDAAPGWERQRGFLERVGAPVTERLVGLLDPRPGETVLELACGNGEVGLAIAPLLDGGTLVQSDLEPAMVAAAKREAMRRGIDGVDHRVLDAGNLDLPDESVDGIVCRFGYMLADDPVGALAESRRVMRRDGRGALAVWASTDDNPWGTLVRTVLRRRDLIDEPDPSAPGPFRLGGPGQLEDAVARAGLALLAVEEVAIAWRVPTASAFWEVTLDLSNVTRGCLEQLDGEVVAAVRDEVAEGVAHWESGGEVSIPGLARVALVGPDSKHG